MLQLAIECSGIHGSIAMLSKSETIGLASLPTDRSSVQSLAATVKALLHQHARSPEFISVTQGPGSFTGLRVGLTTAKMLAMAWQIPLVAVDTLEVLACQILLRQASHDPAIIVPVINAFRSQVFTSGWISSSPSGIIPLFPTQVVDADRWTAQPITAQVPSQDLCQNSNLYSSKVSEILVGGPGLQNYQPGEFCQGSGLPIRIIGDITPDARWVGQIGWTRFQAGQIESAESLSANYVRASAAEDKLAK
jgi:tRNA threonylcarbamoyladenosine biosynthesis protein TsaB